ncbi:transglutaminase family protein [Crossiella sp. CA198]|uniref:transglutaminase family protein n=1 Tax=Crossiella sp. CA198 TaxID=3455607 RepID=UPI003F8D7A70
MNRRRAVTAPVGWTGPVVPSAAGLAVLTAATSLSGVISGMRWLVFVAVTVAVIVGTGIALRSVRTPTPLVALGQFAGLLCFLTAVFTRSGILVVLPGPGALGDLLGVLRQAMAQVQTGVAPVTATAAMLCLVCVALGLVAIVVDTLAVAAAAPAASGLVLLCVFAVPASLADELLPWWSFAAGAAGFALLLVIDERQRHRLWRGRLGLPALRSGDGSAPAAAGVAASAVAIALVAGAVLTMVGTAGRLPGGGAADSTASIGLNTFTSLRGQLERDSSIELFRVRGLPEKPPYLRVTTLSKFDTARGFEVDSRLDNQSTRGELAMPPGTTRQRLLAEGRPLQVEIEAIGYLDPWLPVYGVPMQLANISEDWNYDPGAGIVHAPSKRQAGKYLQSAVLPEPSIESMRAAPGGRSRTAGLIGERYFEHNVDPQVESLARNITRNAGTDYDKAVAIRHFLAQSGGFKYQLRTAGTGQGDPLVDFLFNGKTGYCEQFASSMAAMLRSVGVPSRVAVGFTPGYNNSGYYSITTNDAHAWVEVFFNGVGWIQFDPTPLPDSRGSTGTYEQPTPGAPTSSAVVPSTGRTTTAAPTTTGLPGQDQGEQGNKDNNRDDSIVPVWVWFTSGPLALLAMAAAARGAAVSQARRRERRAGVAAGGKEPPELWWGLAALCGGIAVLVPLWFLVHPIVWWLLLALGVAGVALAVPSWLRRYLRDRRLHAVALGGPDAAGAAWQELMAASVDRGSAAAGTETVRAAARKLVREHKLDERGQNGLRTIIGAVERSWYGGAPHPEPELFAAVRQVLESLTASSPLGWRSRLFPPSVLRPAR